MGRHTLRGERGLIANRGPIGPPCELRRLVDCGLPGRIDDYNVISEEQAERFLGLQGTPELRRALEAWVD